MRSFWDRFGVVWNRLGIILGVALGSCRRRFGQVWGMNLRSFWDRFGVVRVSSGGCLGDVWINLGISMGTY